jgi:hypothetical protein
MHGGRQVEGGTEGGAALKEKDLSRRCHSERSEESRPENKGIAGFLALRPKAFGRRAVACGSSE